MNYYSYYPLITQKPSLFGGIMKGFNFQSILNGTQKVLNIANQAIPLIKQASPMINNAKTMFRVINEFRRSENTQTFNQSTSKTSKVSNNNVINEVSDNKESENEKVIHTNGPTFFSV